MADLRENAISLLNSISGVDLNAIAVTNLYIVPAGKTAWVTHVVIRDVSADTALTVASFGQTGDTDDWTMRLALGRYLDAANDAMIIHPRQWLQAQDTWDPANIPDGDEEAHDVTCTDAELGDFAIASFSLDVADLVLNAQVTAGDVVTCVLANNTGAGIDLGSGTIRVRVFKYNAGFIEYTAGEIFCIDVTIAAGGACTATVDVFGYLA